MKALLAFMFLIVVVSGSRLDRRIQRRPMLLLPVAMVVALSYYWLRVIQ